MECESTSAVLFPLKISALGLDDPSSDDTSTSTGLIAGVSVGAAAVALILVGAIARLWLKKKNQAVANRQDLTWLGTSPSGANESVPTPSEDPSPDHLTQQRHYPQSPMPQQRPYLPQFKDQARTVASELPAVAASPIPPTVAVAPPTDPSTPKPYVGIDP